MALEIIAAEDALHQGLFKQLSPWRCCMDPHSTDIGCGLSS
jgi:hypothetical protein